MAVERRAKRRERERKKERHLHDVGGDGIGGYVEVAVAQRLEDAEALAPAAADQQPVLGFDEAEDPGVALHGRLFARHGRRLFGQQVEALGLDVGHQARVRPRHVRDRPVGRRARPHARTLERRRDLHHEAFADAQLHLGRVGHHFHHVAVRRLVARLFVGFCLAFFGSFLSLFCLCLSFARWLSSFVLSTTPPLLVS